MKKYGSNSLARMKSMTPEMFERIQIVFAKTSKYTGVDAKVFPKPDKTFIRQNVQYLGIAKLKSLLSMLKNGSDIFWGFGQEEEKCGREQIFTNIGMFCAQPRHVFV